MTFVNRMPLERKSTTRYGDDPKYGVM